MFPDIQDMGIRYEDKTNKCIQTFRMFRCICWFYLYSESPQRTAMDYLKNDTEHGLGYDTLGHNY
jgi:hypothetical protein